MFTSAHLLFSHINRLLLQIVVLFLAVFTSVPSFAIPQIEHWTTSQGGRVYFIPTQGLPVIDVRMVFDAGSARDGTQWGVASLTAGMLDTGAGKWDADTIAHRFESVGALFSSGATRDSAYVALRSITHSEKWAVALDTLHEILAHPLFAEEDFEREQQRTLLAIRQRGEDPGEIAEVAFMKAVYGDHPYAHPVEGMTETVTSLTQDDVADFYRRLYTIKNGVLVIVGEVTRLQAEGIADRLFSALPEGGPQPDLPLPSVKNTASTVDISFPSEQTHLYLGELGMKINDPDYFPLHIGNHILGGSGLVSRIMEEVREKRGFAYSASSHFFPLRYIGPFQIGLQTKNVQSKEALEVAIKTVRDFIENGPTDDEVEAAKQNIIGGFVLRLDSNQKLAGEVASIAFYNRPLDYLATFTKKIQSVTRKEIQQAFRSRIDLNRLQTIRVGRAF